MEYKTVPKEKVGLCKLQWWETIGYVSTDNKEHGVKEDTWQDMITLNPNAKLQMEEDIGNMSLLGKHWMRIATTS